MTTLTGIQVAQSITRILQMRNANKLTTHQSVQHIKHLQMLCQHVELEKMPDRVSCLACSVILMDFYGVSF